MTRSRVTADAIPRRTDERVTAQRYPDSMFVPPGIPRRGKGRMKYIAIELLVAAIFLGIYAMVLTRGQIVGW